MRIERQLSFGLACALLCLCSVKSGAVRGASDELTVPSGLVEAKINDLMIHAGFENVAVRVGRQQAFVTYENRIYRNEVRAIKEILKLSVPQLGRQRVVILIPQNRKIPLVALALPLARYRAMIAGQISEAAFVESIAISQDVGPAWSILRNAARQSSSLAKLDIVLHPTIIAQFGNYDDPVETEVGLATELSTSLWRGMRLSGQIRVPLYSDLRRNEQGVRPRLITLNQTMRLPGISFLSATVGYFTRNRYGLDVQARKYILNGIWSFGARVGYSGFAIHENGRWRYDNLDQLIAFLNAEFQLPRIDLLMRASYGQYLFNDRGARVDLVRRFGEVDFGFFALVTQAGRNGGVAFSLPLFPRKYLPAKRVRIRPARDFSWEYRYRGLQDGALLYSTGNGLDDFVKRLNPNYLRNQLREFEGWSR